VASRQPDIAEAAEDLYDLLIRPAEPRLARCQRILFIPDGPLHILPFAALMRSDQQTADRYLVERWPLHTAMSATVFGELRRSRAAPGAIGDGSVIVFGDPLYQRPAGDRDSGADRGSDGPIVRRLNLEPLPSTRAEAEAIQRVFPGQTQVFLGASATEQQAKAVGPGARIVHFACHGLIDSQMPLNSALALSLTAGKQQGADNGLLQAWEVMERMRLDADLVTLSACNTALGEELGGEGLIGLTRAFQYAGARSVVASLWSVGDESTAVLMGRFYGYLAERETHDQALRHAQLDLLRGTATRPGASGVSEPVDAAHPYFWAAFQLVGDWQ
jgi:CHAT domain-containing protein